MPGQRQSWAFWIAALFAFVAGAASVVFGGLSSRIGGAAIPFWIAAIVFGLCARYRGQSRALAVGLYFIGGLAVVYGMLQLVSLPLRLALVGTCPPAPAHCSSGLERPIAEGEQTGIWFGVGMGLVAIFVGYFGLFNLLRRPVAKGAPAAAAQTSPPVRKIPPIQDPPEEKAKPTDAPSPTSDKE